MTIPKARASLVAVIFAAAGLCAGPALAQEGRAAALQTLTDCRKLTEGMARLACYDAAVAGIDAAEAKGDIVVVDRDQARQVRRQGFGFNLPSLAMFERGEPAEAIENVSGVIDALNTDPTGKWIVKLQDGAIWKQVDGNLLHRTPKVGMGVKIRRAALGSYLISIDGQGAFRAARSQ